MPELNTVLRRWLPLAAATCTLSMLTYCSVQNSIRGAGNEPQVQLAEDAARAISNGSAPDSVAPRGNVDIELSLAPFVNVYDASAHPIAGTGLLDGKLPAPPKGIFDEATARGEYRVTWMPRRSVRMATVIRPIGGANGGFVLAGRGMREMEAHTHYAGMAFLCACFGTLAITLVLIVFGEAFLASRRRSHEVAGR